jgi:hypothetical protein
LSCQSSQFTAIEAQSPPFGWGEAAMSTGSQPRKPVRA